MRKAISQTTFRKFSYLLASEARLRTAFNPAVARPAHTSKRLMVAICASALVLAACGGSDDPAPSSSAAVKDAAQACSSLVGTHIASADIGLPTSGAVVNSATLVPAAAPLSEYCLINGSIAPADANAQATTFGLALPTQWNSKAMHFGGGGFDGVVPDLTATPLVSGLSPLARGYVVFGSDGGHQAPASDPVFSASFGLNDEMLKNYGGDALKKTHDVALKLIAIRYGSAPKKVYFGGGSKGGHEGMQIMQKWGDDYDGIISAFPAYAVSPTYLSWQGFSRALYLNAGAGFLSPGKVHTLHAAELAACDALDGAADGVISNVAACTFTPASLQCVGGADTGDNCLSDAQIQTVLKMQSRTNFPYALKNGVTSFPGFYVSTDYASSLGAAPQFPAPPNDMLLGAMAGLGEAIVRNFVLQDPAAYSLSFDPLAPGDKLSRVLAVSNILDATSTDIQPFINKGGKWILVHGLSDQLIPFAGSVDYYNSLLAKFGQASVANFMRFYQIPGYGHGTGSFNATGGMPTLDALEAWVEQGVAPGNLTVTDGNPSSNGRTRPLCLYPTWPKYKGSGDLNLAASYDCASS